jgi:uncharacterized protein (DUF362 family)
MKQISRRQLLRDLVALAYGAIGTHLLVACAAPAEGPSEKPIAAASPTVSPPTAEPMPTETPRPTTQPVAPAGQRSPTGPTAEQAYLAVCRGADPAAITRAAIAALGGIERFVRPDDDVIVKPNICVDYHPPEYAATTNPIVVATLVTLSREAGARRVRVMDMPFGGTPESAYAVSGIGDAVREAGGEMEIMSRARFVQTPIPDGRDLSSWEVYRAVLEADVLINVPIAKHHSLSRLTLGGKNLLGVVLNPNQLHRNLGQRIADLVSLLRPALTVVDAVRILTARGPTGGSLNDVRQTDTVIASHDIVAADAWAATLFGLAGADIAYVRAAADMELGTLELDSVRVEEISV